MLILKSIINTVGNLVTIRWEGGRDEIGWRLSNEHWFFARDIKAGLQHQGGWEATAPMLDQLWLTVFTECEHVHNEMGNPLLVLFDNPPAASDDLIHWHKYLGNPLLPLADNKSSGIVVPFEAGYRLYTMHPEVWAYSRK